MLGKLQSWHCEESEWRIIVALDSNFGGIGWLLLDNIQTIFFCQMAG
jgi:hypothetical protein